MKRPTFFIILLSIISAAFSQTVGAAVLRVPNDYKDISSAVARASEGDIITVGKGTYKDNIVIKKPLSLRSAAGAPLTVITASNSSEPALSIINVSGGSVTGFTFRGSDVSGLLIKDSRRIMVTHNRSMENDIGLSLISSAESSILNNNLDSNWSYGIYLERSSGNRLRDNTSNSNGDKGIFLSYSNNNLLTGNSANLNTWNGILLWTSNNNTIIGNRTLRNTYGVVSGESTGNILRDNTTVPNIFIIMPIFLIYIGVLFYQIEKLVFRAVYMRS